MSEIWNEGQLKAISNTSRNMIVSASAGSGKTATMIERVKRLVINEHVPISRIMMLSFNEAIASEIKEKMAKALIVAIKDDTNRDEKDYLREQIDELGTADITTMHAFCNSLIKEYFDKVGVDPAYGIMDDKESDVIINKCVNEVFDEYFESRDVDFIALKDKLASTSGDDELRNAVVGIFKFASSLLGGDEWLDNAVHDCYGVPLERTKPVKYLVKEIIAKVNIATDALTEAVTALDMEKYTGMDVALDFLMKYANEENIIAYEDMAEKAPVLPNKRPRVGSAEHEYYTNAKNTYKDIISYVGELFPVPFKKMSQDHEADGVMLLKLIEIVKRFETLYNREKAESCKLDFNDMEHYAAEILADESIRDTIKAKYDYICIDEYQDTNEVQNMIFESVSNGHNLFMVGDPKQSIYKFRFTEPEIFIRRMTEYGKKGLGDVVELDNNYRSSPLILKKVNNVFDVLMRRQRAGMIREVYSSLMCGLKDVYEREYQSDVIERVSQPFEVMLYEGKPPKDEDKCNRGTYRVSEDDGEIDEMLDASIEARYIATKVEMLRKSKIYDAKQGTWRYVEYDDMVILASNRTPHVKNVLELLEGNYSLPIDSTSLKRKEEPQEVKILLDFLRVIDNSRQDIPLYTVMKVFFDFRDSDFVEMRHMARDAKNFYNIVFDDMLLRGDMRDRVDVFRRELDEYRLMATFMNVHDFLMTVVDKTKYKERLLMSRDGKIALDNITKFIATLKDKKHASTIEEFLYAYDNYDIKNDIDATSQNMNNAIHTSTIHQSKGLEYPVVFMIGLGASFVSTVDSRSPYLLDKDYGIAIKTFDEQNKTVYPNLLMKALLAKHRQEEIEERFRLFYVAMTRAKSCLYMVGRVSKDKKDIDTTHKFSDILYDIGSECSDFEENIVHMHVDEMDELIATSIVTAERPFDRVDYSESESRAYASVFDYVYPHEKATHMAQKYTVTSINHEEREQEEYVPELYETEKTSVGSIYHKFMECVNYEADTLPAIQAEMARMVDENILTEDDISVICIDDVYKCLNSSIIKTARVNRHDREKKFMMCLPMSEVKEGASDEKVIIQGIADLVIYGEHNILVDFKKSSQPEFMLRDAYRRQLELYKFALEKSMNITIDEMYLYVIGQDVIIDMSE